MATKKRRGGPKIHTYVLTVNAETGKVLSTQLEDPVTGRRKRTKMVFSSAGSVIPHGPETRILGGIQPVTRLNLTNLHVVPRTAPINPGPARKKTK